MKNKAAIKLFLAKEGKELMGKHHINAVILAGIFLLAILSIGFGSASLKYLKYKMDDPFINWVDIIAQQHTNGLGTITLEDYLKDKTIQKQFEFINPTKNYTHSAFFRQNGNSTRDILLEGRSIDVKSKVLDKILEDDNVIVKRDIKLSDEELGIIITQEAVTKLGYNNPPQFVFWSKSLDVPSCNDVGLDKGLDGFYPIALPVVAIVKQLPGMYSFLFSNRFLDEVYSNDPVDISLEENNNYLMYCGTNADLQTIQELVAEKGVTCLPIEQNIQTWDNNLYRLKIESNNIDGNLTSFYNQLNNSINASIPKSVTRTYDFQKPVNPIRPDAPYFAIEMNSLDKIGNFADDLYKNCGIKLEMTNINAKENFHFVERMGNILSYCVILIAVVFICVFIYFLLSSHFQKIQQNLGTFKAFGIRNKFLLLVYSILMSGITLGAFAVAFGLAWLCTFLISLKFNIEIGYVWIDVLVWQNILLIVLSLLASVLATSIVANEMLKNTPGHLIKHK